MVKDKGLQVENESKHTKVLAFKKNASTLFTPKRWSEFHLLTFPACIALRLISEQAGREREKRQFHLLAKLSSLNPLAFCWLLIQQKLLLQNS